MFFKTFFDFCEKKFGTAREVLTKKSASRDDFFKKMIARTMRRIMEAQRYWRSFSASVKLLPTNRVSITAEMFPRSMRSKVKAQLQKRSAYPCNPEQIFLPRKFSNPSVRWIVFDQRRKLVHLAPDVRDYLNQALTYEIHVETLLRVLGSLSDGNGRNIQF